MGLFDKKFCSVCGEKIGVLGNRKLEDGNLCKECANKLSPWFSERKSSTVDDIKGQLEYRENNKQAVAAFNPTRTFGTDYKVILDEDAKKFIVTSASNWKNANPDVLDFSDVTGCNLEIEEDKDEIMQKDREGKEVSYNPPRYNYEYDFYMTIDVNNPYFNQMRFKLNSSSVVIEPDVTQTAGGMFNRPVMPTHQQAPANRVGGGAMGGNVVGRPAGMQSGSVGPRPAGNQSAYAAARGNNVPPAHRVGAPQAGTVQSRPAMPQSQPARPMASSSQVTVKKVDPTTNAKYMEYKEMGEEIRAALLQIRQDVRDSAAPQAAVVCPYCGATTIPDENGRCEYCGAAVYQ